MQISVMPRAPWASSPRRIGMLPRPPWRRPCPRSRGPRWSRRSSSGPTSTSARPTGGPGYVTQLPNRKAWESFEQRRPGGERHRVQRVHRPAVGRGHQHHRRLPAHPRERRRQRGDARPVSPGSSAAPVPAVDADVVGAALRRFVARPRDVLGIDTRQLGAVKATRSTPDCGRCPCRSRCAACPSATGAWRRDQPRQPGDDRHRDLGRRAHGRHARVSAAQARWPPASRSRGRLGATT